MFNGARVATQGSYTQRPEEAQARGVASGQVNQGNAPTSLPTGQSGGVIFSTGLSLYQVHKETPQNNWNT